MASNDWRNRVARVIEAHREPGWSDFRGPAESQFVKPEAETHGFSPGEDRRARGLQLPAISTIATPAIMTTAPTSRRPISFSLKSTHPARIADKTPMARLIVST